MEQNQVGARFHHSLTFTFLLLSLQLIMASKIRVADILESEKVTPSSVLQGKRITSGSKVADILESEKVVTQPSVSQNKKPGEDAERTVTEQPTPAAFSSDPSQNDKSEFQQKYPLLTLTNSYNKDIPPKPKHGGPVQVDFYILLVDIRDINEVEEEMSLEYNLQIFWKDERLTQWDRNSSKFLQAKKMGRKYEVLTPIMNDIWIPDMFIDHVKHMDQHKLLTTPQSLRLYYSDGTFRYSGRFTMTIACQMEFHYYPADTQRCPVNIKSYAYKNGTVFVSWRENKTPAMKKSILLPNFQVGIGGALSNRIITSSSEKSDTYSEITFIVVLRRFLGFHLIQTYLPSCLFVVISFLTFLVSSESVLECLTLCMTTLLTLTAMFASVKQNTPTVSYVKGLDIWMVTCIFCVFFTLLEHTILLKLRTQITEKAKKVDELNKKKMKKRKSIFNLTPSRGGSKQSRHSKHSTRPSQEPLTPFYKAGLKKAEQKSSDSGSDSSPNVQLRRYPQPTPPASIHLSPPSPMMSGMSPNNGMNQNFNNSMSPASIGHRLSLSQCQSPVMMSPDAMLLSTPLTPQFATMLSKKATKRFKLSRTLEILCSKLIPISFLLFNVIYWPWLLQSADYYNNTAFLTTKYI